MGVLRVRGRALPSGEWVDLYADGDRWTWPRSTPPGAGWRCTRSRRPGGAAAVAAGVDSLKHGMYLDPALLAQMAAQGTALTPTLSVITGSLERMRARPDSPPRRWYLAGATAHPHLAAAAVEAGVVVMAGTDSRPHGRVADEVRALAAAGVRPHDALGAASWAARSYLGLPGLVPEAPADVVVYDEDPRTNLAQLDSPRAVVLRGVLAFRR